MKYDSIDKMDPNDFELLVGMCFVELGYTVYMTKKTKDGGVDVVLECYLADFNDWLRFVIQVKRYKTPADVSHVRELNGILPLWGADKGTLICTGGFTGDAKEEAAKLQISLVDKEGFKEKLTSAKLLTPDEEIISIKDSNLEKNRRRSIIDCLFINRPKILSINEIIILLRREYGITVSDTILLEDLEKLSKDGYILKLENGFHYRLTPTDIRKAKEFVSSVCIKWEHFFKKEEIISTFCRESSISQEVGSIYLIGIIEKELLRLTEEGIIRHVEDFYFGTRGFEAFQSKNISKEKMEVKLTEILGLKKEDYDKPISEFFKIEDKNKAQVFSLIDDNGEKIAPFTMFAVARCPSCGGLMFSLWEDIPAIVYPSTMDGLIGTEIFKGQVESTSTDFQRLPEIMEFSRIFVERIISLSKKYIIGEGERISFHPFENKFSLFVSLDFKEGKMGDLITLILEVFSRFQIFLSELYNSIEDYGVPRLFSFPKKENFEVRVEKVEENKTCL